MHIALPVGKILRKRRATANCIITTLKAILNHAFKTDRVKSNEAWQKLKPFKCIRT